MNKIFKISVLVTPYLFLIFCVLIFKYWRATWVGIPILLGYLFVTVAVYVPNMIYSAVLSRNSEVSSQEVLQFAVTAKSCHIMFYAVVFLVAFACLMTVISVAIIPFLCIVDYFLLLTTSAYSNCGIKKAVKEGIISKSDSYIFIVLNFFFVLDIISTVRAYAKIKSDIL